MSAYIGVENQGNVQYIECQFQPHSVSVQDFEALSEDLDRDEFMFS